MKQPTKKVITHDEYAAAVQTHVAKNAQKLEIEKEVKNAAAVIKGYIVQQGGGLICEAGVETSLSYSVRRSLSADLVKKHLEAVAKKHGFELTAEDADICGCYTSTDVATLRVARVLDESKPAQLSAEPMM